MEGFQLSPDFGLPPQDIRKWGPAFIQEETGSSDFVQWESQTVCAQMKALWGWMLWSLF